VFRLSPFSVLAFAVASPAAAGEVFGGLYVHDIKTPLDKSGIEGGVDLQAGYRWDPLMGAKGPEPYVFVAANSAGKTHLRQRGWPSNSAQRSSSGLASGSPFIPARRAILPDLVTTKLHLGAECSSSRNLASAIRSATA